MARSAARAPMTEDDARRRVARERKFYGGLGAYATVMLGLLAVNLLTGPGTLWVVWPALGWGLGIVGEAIRLFGLPGMSGWESRRLNELTGQGVSEARLRQVLDETLDERAVPSGAPQTADRLQRRIEHLEAIVTSRDWDEAASLPETEAPPRGALSLGPLDDEETPSERTARLARRVR